MRKKQEKWENTTDQVASQPPERHPTAMPTAHANY